MYNPFMTPPTATPTKPLVPNSREHIAITPGVCGGKPRIAGHRIKVAHVAIWHERMGETPEQIVEQHPGVTLADVYAALTYYHDHKEEVDADIRAGEELANRLRGEQPSLMERIAVKRLDVLALSTRAAIAYVRSSHCPAEDLDRLRAALSERRAAAPDDPDLAELQAELSVESQRP
jgi:uncharacterized protein (DUF433 family)